MMAHSQPTRLDRYGFLAGAIAGRRVTIQRAPKDGSLAYSDGRSIFLPILDTDDGHDAWAAIAAQAALMGAGSLHPAMLGQLVGRPTLARRYLYLEMLRAAYHLANRLPWAFTERLELRQPLQSDSARGSLERAATRAALPEPPDYFGRIRPLLVLGTAVSEQGLAALSPAQQRGQFNSAAVPELRDDDEGESSKLLRLFQNPFSNGNPLSDLLNTILGAGVSKQHRGAEFGDSGGTDVPVGRVERALRRGVTAVLSRLPIQTPALDLGATGPEFIYPEWDVHAGAYRRDWVNVEEAEAWREASSQVPGEPLAAAPAELRRQLNGLGVDQEMHRRQIDGSDLDLDALIESAIECRAGHTPPGLQVYRASRRTRRDLAVALVVDISGSTGEQPPSGDSIFKQQLQVAYQVGQALDSLGDTVAIFGFHSWGRKLLRVVRIKGHVERWSVRVAERMALLEPAGYTRVGAAIRHGTHVLNHTMRLPNRLLVLVTDGIPYDQDYELSYAAADTGRALAEARDAGTACVCLSVGSGSDTATLREVFGAANILAVDEVTQVTGRIRDVCRHALASVSKRRWTDPYQKL